MKSYIKSIVTGLGMLFITLTPGFSQENKIDLRIPEVQQQVFNQILSDSVLMENFIVQLKSNQAAMNSMISGISIQCCTYSNCNRLTEKAIDQDDSFIRFGKLLLEKEQVDYAVMPRPRYKHK